MYSAFFFVKLNVFILVVKPVSFVACAATVVTHFPCHSLLLFLYFPFVLCHHQLDSRPSARCGFSVKLFIFELQSSALLLLLWQDHGEARCTAVLPTPSTFLSLPFPIPKHATYLCVALDLLAWLGFLVLVPWQMAPSKMFANLFPMFKQIC